ncbi:MAG TPA: hypothetical protein PLK77_04225 [Pyrinomonadaceae bacterium]|nr:hypothetical protein [Pyrinomonadaceae bacterium]
MQTVREIYTQTIRPLGEGQRLELATLILEEITSDRTKESKAKPNGNGGGLRELFGSVSLGHPTGADNESIDADLAREYGNDHEDEN